MIETGSWKTIKDAPPLPANVHLEITVTVLADGTIECRSRNPEGRTLEQVVKDTISARDRLTTQINERFTRCPMFKAANQGGQTTPEFLQGARQARRGRK